MVLPTASQPRSKAFSLLNKLGLQRDIDLVLHLPLRYEDETQLHTITAACALATAGSVLQVEGIIQNSEITRSGRRQLHVRVADASGTLLLRFLNFYASQVQQMTIGKRLRIRGEIRNGFFGAEMIHPTFKFVQEDEPLPQTLTPVYPTTTGLGQAYLRKAIHSALARTSLAEILPKALFEPELKTLQLWPLAQAVQFLHYPPAHTDLFALSDRTHPAWKRIKFDELLAQQLSFKRAYAQRRTLTAVKLLSTQNTHNLVTRLCNALPFTLTAAQQKVWREISADLAQNFPMQRLLQGDVGSGKTIVAALAAAQTIDNGYQVALMVPTELLAEQHFQKFTTWFESLDTHIVWLTGSLRAKEKREAYQKIADGHAHIVIGTHALIQKEVTFARLGLVIVDEQHRFGVSQRQALRQLNNALNATPHQLMMSATPIPRTLAMTYYADLDVSTIDALPPGRSSVITRVMNNTRRAEIIDRIRVAAQTGRQIYWVCPLIEESEALQLQTAVETYQNLCEALPELSIGLIHGRLSTEEKTTLMTRFIANELQLLVATTVIEVGVDVPNASLMIIEHAERFGLAQLHQLRGRVGRGTAQSVCILLYQGPLSFQARQRLAIMRETNNGFMIAQRDLDIRGPGEFLGAKQSGQILLRFVDLAIDTDLVEPVRITAQRMLEEFPDAVEAHLNRWLGTRIDYLKV